MIYEEVIHLCTKWCKVYWNVKSDEDINCMTGRTRKLLEFYYEHIVDAKYINDLKSDSCAYDKARAEVISLYYPHNYSSDDSYRSFSYTDPLSWKSRAPSKEDIENELQKKYEDINAQRVKWFVDKKNRYRIPDNKTLSRIIGVKDVLFNEFEDLNRGMNINVFYILCLFFELTVDEAKKTAYLGDHILGTEPADYILLMYLDNSYYDIAAFVETVNVIYENNDYKMPSLFNTESDPYHKRFGSYSISDCINEDGSYRYEEIIRSRREMYDLRKGI